MSQIMNVEVSEIKNVTLKWSETHQCVIYVVEGGACYVAEKDMDGDIYYDEVEVVITTPPAEQSFFRRFF